MTGMRWSGETNRLNEYQLDMHRSHLSRQSDQELIHSYGVYWNALRMRDGKAPSASKIQYLVETWRELRRRQQRAASELKDGRRQDSGR